MIRRIAGDHLRIICNRPQSFPEAEIYWNKKTSAGLIQIDYNDRITIDPDGESKIIQSCSLLTDSYLYKADVIQLYHDSGFPVDCFSDMELLVFCK